jgi:hypothetical protein
VQPRPALNADEIEAIWKASSLVKAIAIYRRLAAAPEGAKEKP